MPANAYRDFDLFHGLADLFAHEDEKPKRRRRLASLCAATVEPKHAEEPSPSQLLTNEELQTELRDFLRISKYQEVQQLISDSGPSTDTNNSTEKTTQILLRSLIDARRATASNSSEQLD